MVKRRVLLAAGVSASLVASLLALPAAVSAQAAGAYLDGAEPWTESDCAGEEPIVVGSDAKAQSDIYSAVTLAGVVGTDCVVLAGPRDEGMAADQQARLDSAAAGGYVLGGTAAVPQAKVAGRNMTRLGGATRWETAQLIGSQARALAEGQDPGTSSVPDAMLSAPSDVQQPGVFLDGAEPWIASECADDVPIVVGSDARAQSDIYSAVTLAGVVGTDCVVLAGPRDGDMPASQRARLGAADAGGFVLGGIAAVPTAKIAGRDMTRLGGATRWATAQLVGRRASGDTTAGTSTATEKPQQPEDRQEGETEGQSGETQGVPDPVMPNQAWLNYQAEIIAFLENCGWWDRDRGGYGQCENSEDTSTVTQMSSDFYGCQYDEESSRCEGYSYWEFKELEDRLACGQDLHLSWRDSGEGYYEFWCFHPDHPDYEP